MLKNNVLGKWMIIIGAVFLGIGILGVIFKSANNALLDAPDVNVAESDFADKVLPSFNPVRAPLTPSVEYGVDKPVKHEIVELFMYTCPHCHTISPLVFDLKSNLDASVHMEIIPVVFQERDLDYIRLHYALLALDVPVEDVVNGIFKAVHTDRNPPRSPKEFTGLGVEISGKSAMMIAGAMASEAVNEKTEISQMQFFKSGSNAVPTFVVDGINRLDLGDFSSMNSAMSVLADSVNAGR